MKVLIADDSLADQMFIGDVLRCAGCDTIIAPDGRAAVELALEHRPKLIFMDIVMPILDGLAAARELARNRLTHEIPVVFVTSKSKQRDRLWGELLGGQDYLTKPCDPQQLVSQLIRADRNLRIGQIGQAGRSKRLVDKSLCG